MSLEPMSRRYYMQKPCRSTKNLTLWSAAILNTAAMLAAALKNKVDDNHLGTERILCAENPVKICYRLGEEAGHTRGHADKRTRGQAHKRTHRCQKGLP